MARGAQPPSHFPMHLLPPLLLTLSPSKWGGFSLFIEYFPLSKFWISPSLVGPDPHVEQRVWRHACSVGYARDS